MIQKEFTVVVVVVLVKRYSALGSYTVGAAGVAVDHASLMARVVRLHHSPQVF